MAPQKPGLMQMGIKGIWYGTACPGHICRGVAAEVWGDAQQTGTWASSEAAAWFEGILFSFMSFFSSYLGLAGVGRCGGVCMWHLMNLVSFFPGFQQFIENTGFSTFSVKIFAFLFYLGRKVCGFFYPRLKTFFPCLASLAARGSHTCTLVQCCPAHWIHLCYY